MTQEKRDTSARGRIKDSVRHALWAKTAGRCTLCNRRLLGGQRTHIHSTLAAQLAHNVGASDSKGSPRGQEGDTTNRESEENLLLVCHDCHKMIDAPDLIEMYTAEFLRNRKQAHELFIERATDHGALTRTAAVRVGATQLRNAPALAPPREVAESLLAHNFFGLVDSQWSGDFSCQLVGKETDAAFWAATQHTINTTIDRVHQAAARGDVQHISIFAIAPIPALVYLGSRLDDKVTTEVYQRHRDRHPAWAWPDEGDTVTFAHAAPQADNETTEVVIAVSLSAEVNLHRVPKDLHDAPVFSLGPTEGATPEPQIINTKATLNNFRDAFHRMLADIEKTCPNANTWHLVAATPVSPAVIMGTQFMRSAQPPVVVYQREGDNYLGVLQVNQ